MVGNDVIALDQVQMKINDRFLRKLKKICTPNEMEFILNYQEPHKMFWIVWSAKECGYKIWNRVHRIQIFNPKEFVVEFKNFGEGYVHGHSMTYNFRVKINPTYIHTVAISQSIDWGEINEAVLPALTKIRPQACQWLRDQMSIGKHEKIEIKENIPTLYIGNRKTKVNISLSHDGNLFAIACSNIKV